MNRRDTNVSKDTNQGNGHTHLFPAPGTDRILELHAMITLQAHRAFVHVLPVSSSATIEECARRDQARKKPEKGSQEANMD